MAKKRKTLEERNDSTKTTSSLDKTVEKKDSSSFDVTFSSTEEIDVSKSVISQVIGQDHAVEVIQKAAKNRRHVLLIGEPGTGKSMLGIALSQLLPKEKLVDILSFPNNNDENNPFIRVMPAGKGRDFVTKARMQNMSGVKGQTIFLFLLLFIVSLFPWWAWRTGIISDVIYAASLIASMMFFIGIVFIVNISRKMSGNQQAIGVPKVIVDNFEKDTAPFLDATGAHAGALLGDVLHDPFQSGGLGTPAHERIVAGMIHKAHLGVLFIDEISTLNPTMQQELLTAIQEGKFSITGRSERSAGAMVRTEAVPCNFVLVAAGNYDSIARMHPALRSRIRGYGYEIYMNDTMPDTKENRYNIARFVAQEVRRDKRIPHFDASAVEVIIQEARRRANRKGHLTIRFRELGGIIRSAGDVALEQQAKIVSAKHVKDGMLIARPLEKQISDKIIDHKKEYEVILTKGSRVGRVNGLSVMGISGSTSSGMVLPIESTIVPGGKQPVIIATGKLGEIAKESITNVSALIKTLFGEEFSDPNKLQDVYVQFLQTYEGLEGDSASIAVAVAVISALKKIPVRQDLAMTGSLSVRGEILPVGGVTYKVEAAIGAGLKKVLIPYSNAKDVVLHKDLSGKIEIIPVTTFVEVLKHSFDWKNHKSLLTKIEHIHLL